MSSGSLFNVNYGFLLGFEISCSCIYLIFCVPVVFFLGVNLHFKNDFTNYSQSACRRGVPSKIHTVVNSIFRGTTVSRRLLRWTQ